MKFSVCIPNYNYELYLGRTLQSVLDQSYGNWELLVSDNASTDGSVDIVKGLDDPRVRLHINQCNVGFAANLDRAGGMASGDVMIMLSSDDLMRPCALEKYRDFFDSLGPDYDNAIVSSTCDVIDAHDDVVGRNGPDAELWRPTDIIKSHSVAKNATVYRVEGRELLRRCLRTRKNPFNFLATAYARDRYLALEGYGARRMVNPDKWFHWRLLNSGCVAYFIDAPLFAYRWHSNNQTAGQAATGSLKFLMDEYASTFELEESLLRRIGMERADVERAFVERDIVLHGFSSLATSGRAKAKRIWHFGRAAYPRHAHRNPRFWLLAIFLALGPVGTFIARQAYEHSGRGELSRQRSFS